MYCNALFLVRRTLLALLALLALLTLFLTILSWILVFFFFRYEATLVLIAYLGVVVTMKIEALKEKPWTEAEGA